MLRRPGSVLRRMLPPGSTVRVEADPQLDQVDRYGRLLRYLFRARRTSTWSSSAGPRRSGSTTTTAAVRRALYQAAAAGAQSGPLGRVPGYALRPVPRADTAPAVGVGAAAANSGHGGDRAPAGEPRAVRFDAAGPERSSSSQPGSRRAARARRRGRPRLLRLRGRPRAAAAEARAGLDRAQALGVRSLSGRARSLAVPDAPSRRSGRGDCRPRRRSRRSMRCSTRCGREGPLGPARPRARRARLLGRPAERRGGRPRPPGRRLRAGARCTSAARAARSAPSRSARRPPTGSPSTSATAGPSWRRARRTPSSSPPAAVGSTPAPSAGYPEPAQAPSRLRDAPARGRRRPARDPGAPRPQLALDDADLLTRRRPPPSAGLRSRASSFIATFLEPRGGRFRPPRGQR